MVLVTHGNSPWILRRAGACRRSAGGSAVCIGPEDDMEKRRARISWNAAKATVTGDGVIVLTDMFGGTPSNLAISIMDRRAIEVIAGVNLPMLIKLASVRTRPIAEAVRTPRRRAASTSPSPRVSSPKKACRSPACFRPTAYVGAVTAEHERSWGRRSPPRRPRRLIHARTPTRACC